MLIIPLLVVLFAMLAVALFLTGRRLLRGPSPVYRKQAPIAARPNYNLNQWRAAASEGQVLQRAVDEMQHHCSMVHQLTDSWLEAANQNALDLARFTANVAEAARLRDILEPECAGVVDELRQLEAVGLRHAELRERRLQARAMMEWAQRHEEALRAELAAMAAHEGESVDVLILRANGVAPTTTLARVEALLPEFTADHIPDFRSVMA
ncbi:hypothetical protein KPL74_10905 [Bacillus sp. NP157]|nr:hypothetical protein KPL74_10905 [Bacillus sp. NP157]